jgi:KaiC/GvpD/RAD55 family RecA-like ATPase
MPDPNGSDAPDRVIDPPGAEDAVDRCDYCRLPCPTDPVTAESGTYAFCSEACRDAMRDADRVFTEYHGHRRFRTGVRGIDDALPQGLPRNAFVLLPGPAGSRDGAIRTELAWRTLQRDEPVVIVALLEPPGAVVQRFLTFDWNVLPFLESGRLCIVDGFTYRMADPDRMRDRLSDWNRHLDRAAAGATASVRDPTDLNELANKLDNRLSAAGMTDDGIVVIDSLTELGTLVQPVQAYDFVKNLRADVCKGRFVPVFAGSTLRESDEFPHDLAYAVDGLVELHLDESIVEDTLIKRVRIRKMSGVLTVPAWTAYEYTAPEGMVTFDPEAEIRKSVARRDDTEAAGTGDGPAGTGDDPAGTDDDPPDTGADDGPGVDESGGAPVDGSDDPNATDPGGSSPD